MIIYLFIHLFERINAMLYKPFYPFSFIPSLFMEWWT